MPSLSISSRPTDPPAGRLAWARLSRSWLTLPCGTRIAVPPSASWYGTPSELSLVVIAEASAAVRLVNNGAYCGRPAYCE